MEGHQPQSSGDETVAQRQARIRRERREAKIKAGGSARLDKISSLSGRPTEPVVSPEPLPHIAIDGPADPDEVDISSHSYTGAHAFRESRAASEDDIRRLLRDAANNFPPRQSVEVGPFGPGGDNDSITSMLQQLMGGSAVIGEGRRRGQRGGGNQGGLTPGLAAMLGGAEGAESEQGLGQGQRQPSDRSAYAWRVIHAFLALALGVYMVSMTAFSGARFSRRAEGGTVGNDVGVRFFWAFATTQLTLQSTRYFLERGQAPVSHGGWFGMVLGILPEPWRGWVLLLSRYSVIYSTVVQDAMVVVFVLGCAAWWVGTVA